VARPALIPAATAFARERSQPSGSTRPRGMPVRAGGTLDPMAGYEITIEYCVP